MALGELWGPSVLVAALSSEAFKYNPWDVVKAIEEVGSDDYYGGEPGYVIESKDADYIPILIQILEGEGVPPNLREDASIAAAESLGHIRPDVPGIEKAVMALAGALSDRNTDVAREASWALRELYKEAPGAVEGAVPVLTEAQAQSKESMLWLFEQTLEAISGGAKTQ